MVISSSQILKFDRPTCAPSSCTSLQDSGNTSVATTGYPCFSRFFAIGFPMFPKPINPTGVFEAMDLEDTRRLQTTALMSQASTYASDLLLQVQIFFLLQQKWV